MFPRTKLVGNRIEGAPCSGRITQFFGEMFNPYPHRGLDIGVPVGTPVYAPCRGLVTLHEPGDGWGDGSFGRCIIIDVPGTPWFVLLAHLSSFEARTGMSVEAGDLIAFSGNTGMSTGPHLHWQVCKDGWFGTNIANSADPLSFIDTEEIDVLTDADKIMIYNEMDSRLDARLNAFADAFSGLFRTLMVDYFVDNVEGDFQDASGPTPPDPRVVQAISRYSRLRGVAEHVAADGVNAPVAFKMMPGEVNTASLADPAVPEPVVVVAEFDRALAPGKPEPII